MKGIVFTEFLEMVEEKFGYELADSIIEESDLPSGGAYTAVGTYSHGEMVQLITKLSKKTETPIPKLLEAFGGYIFGTFEKNYKLFLDAASNAFDFLESIEKYIHVEVRKLYPDAELPTFETKRLEDNTLEMIYHSPRKMGAFAYGLIEQSLKYYEEEATIAHENIEEDGSIVRFKIIKA